MPEFIGGLNATLTSTLLWPSWSAGVKSSRNPEGVKKPRYVSTMLHTTLLQDHEDEERRQDKPGSGSHIPSFTVMNWTRAWTGR